jgi:sn-glycerol 3-phosphate transport system substrate-binding protein
MKRRALLAGSAALAAAPYAAARAAEKTKIVWWHAMTAALGEQVQHLVDEFNKSQDAVEVQGVFKGGYADTMNAAIAASRAGQAPHLVQVFEVGTGTMINAPGKFVKQVWELSKETGIALEPKNYIGAVRGYYSLPDGRMASMPFNSSTAMMWYSKDAFKKAGLDPAKPPTTWEEVAKAAKAIKDKDAAEIPCTSAWFSWIQLEQFSALHNLPFASKEDGFDGLDAELKFNSKAHIAHLDRLLGMAKDGTFKYTGRDNTPSQLLISGKVGIHFDSSGSRGDLVKSAQFEWGEALLPYDPQVIKSPLNSIIGGASLWTMTAPGRTPAEYKAVAQFLAFIGKAENDAYWHQHTGYVPVTLAGFELSKKQGFYEKNVGADLPAQQLTRGTVTPNSKGLRLGRLVEIRNNLYEEVEKAFQGGQTAKEALDNAVTRGNKVLRDFQKSIKA